MPALSLFQLSTNSLFSPHVDGQEEESQAAAADLVSVVVVLIAAAHLTSEAVYKLSPEAREAILALHRENCPIQPANQATSCCPKANNTRYMNLLKKLTVHQKSSNSRRPGFGGQKQEEGENRYGQFFPRLLPWPAYKNMLQFGQERKIGEGGEISATLWAGENHTCMKE